MGPHANAPRVFSYARRNVSVGHCNWIFIRGKTELYVYVACLCYLPGAPPPPSTHTLKRLNTARIYTLLSANIGLTRAAHFPLDHIITMTSSTSSSSMTLTYFNFAGPAEPVRMALAMTGQPWKDNRISFQEFGALKPSKPDFVCAFGSLRVKPCRVCVPLQANRLDTPAAAAAACCCAAVAEQFLSK